MYAGEHEGENIVEVYFEDSVKEDGEIVAEDEKHKVSAAIKEENVVTVVDESPLEDLKVLETEGLVESEGKKNMAVDSGEKNVVEKEVIHDIFHFYDEDESVFCVDERIIVEDNIDSYFDKFEKDDDLHNLNKLVETNFASDVWYAEDLFGVAKFSVGAFWWRWSDYGGLNPTILEESVSCIWWS